MRKVQSRIVKILLLLLAGLLAVGCSRGKAEQTEKEEVPVINIGISERTGLSDDLEQVNETLGDLTEEKIGVRAQLVWLGLNSSDGSSYYKSRQMDVDIMNVYFKKYDDYRRKNLLLDMENYLDDAPMLQEVLDEKTSLPENEQDGVYGIPKPLSDLHSNGVMLNRAYVEKYQMDVSQIHHPQDLEPFFDIIKREEPDVIPWALEKRGNAVIERQPIGDVLDGCLSGILYEENGNTVCNLYESEAYEEQVHLAERWQKKGYLAKDILTNIESGKSQVLAGEAFATEFVIKPDEMQYDESIYGEKAIIIPFDNKPVLDTEDDWITVWCIFAETKYPREAVQVLNLLYYDEDVLNVIFYGVEGMHYQVLPDGSFDYPEGVDQDNVCYACSTKWRYNTPKAGIWHGMSENLEKDFEEFKASAVISGAYGFWLDESRITVDIAAMKQIVNEYTPLLETGLCDTTAYLAEFRQKLQEAGSEELVRQVQQQYDEWIKTEKEQNRTEKE